MTIELDHFFILTDKAASLAKQISSIGLIEGTSNNHPGQGTANRRFFLPNSTLELIYVRDVNEALHGRGSRLRFVERASDSIASPFGLIARSVTIFKDTPFPGWHYYPEYFGDAQYFHVGENSDLLEEPLCVCMPTNLSRPEIPSEPENPLWTMTELRISVPVVQPTPPLEALSKCKGVSLRLNEPHRMEIVFNEKKEGRTKEMALKYPVVIHW
jgi:hypothetical protein